MDFEEFRKDSGIIYPPFAPIYFEKYFYEFMENKKKTMHYYENYIPVFWTELQINSNPYNKDKLQLLIDNLPKDKKYFTIVQHDNGITDIKIPKNIF
jgi:hypothetical protein